MIVTLLEAKAHLRILNDVEDDYINGLIETAVAQAEDITSRNLSETSNAHYIQTFSQKVELPKPPLIGVDKIEYVPIGESSYVTLDTSLYAVYSSREPAVIVFDESLDVESGLEAIKISYRSGYIDCPKPIKHWILMRVATLYENREELSTIEAKPIMSDYNDFLISKYRVVRL